jgi:hypothetical protein
MARAIIVAPHVRGPELGPAEGDAEADRSWKTWFKSLFGVFAGAAPEQSTVKHRSQSASAVAAPVVARWAYRVTNYYQLRAAGMTCLVIPPSARAGISSHLDLEAVEPTKLRGREVVLVESGQSIPADGTIIEGIATVDESAITGQSCPIVLSTAGRSVVMRDGLVVEGQILIQVAPRRGHRLDSIDGAARHRLFARGESPVEQT